MLNLPEDNGTSYKIIKSLFIRIKQSRPQCENLSEALRGEDGEEQEMGPTPSQATQEPRRPELKELI